MIGVLFSALLAVAVLAAPAPVQLQSSFGLIVEPAGTLLVADGVSGRIVRVDPRTGRRSLFAQGLGQAYDVEYGPGGVYATTKSQVIRFSGGRKQVLASGLRDPVGLAVARGGTVYVSESTANRVLRIDEVTHTKTVIASTGLDQPLGVALRADGSVLVCDSHHGRIVSVGADGALEPVLTRLALPVNVTVAGSTVYGVDHVEHGRPGRLVRLAPSGLKTVIRTAVHSLTGVAVGRAGVLYVSSFEAPFVGRLTASGALRPL
jgi:sugar lactone lactonase YvrE